MAAAPGVCSWCVCVRTWMDEMQSIYNTTVVFNCFLSLLYICTFLPYIWNHFCQTVYHKPPLSFHTVSLSHLSLTHTHTTHRAAPTDGESLTGPPDDCVWLACPDPQLCASENAREKCSHLWLSARSPLHCPTLNTSSVREATTKKTHLDMKEFLMVSPGLE